MLNTRLNHLFWLCLADRASNSEREELMRLMADKANEEQVNKLYEAVWEDFEPNNPVFTKDQSDKILQNALNNVHSNLNNSKHLPVSKLWSRITIAASVLFVITTGLYFYTKKPQLVSQNGQIKNTITPGSNKAMLILADGSKIVLDSAHNGEIAKQTGIKITKTKLGQLVYTIANTANKNDPVTYNTIETPRGGQYQVNLADGTKIWLNSASSIHFPTAFNSKERKVELTGEAYFEVAKNKALPFRVVSQNQLVEVLGTHFDINSYTDEAKTKTTLLEGSVKVSGLETQSTAILKPGQQSILKSAGSIEVKDVDIEDAVAWKNGYFMFPNENIETIMRKISRWYDVDIEYSGNVSQKAIWGSVSKFKNVTEVLKMLELTGVVHFKIDGRRIIVMP
jgi:transmembrane sensor